MSSLLKKSFNPDKCKILLQLTIKKLNILRSKHVIVAKSLRADVARLLEKGQDSSAKTQVENVFREEKTISLYNLLEQFCQLVIDCFESIKSQRECPSDLKEVVASLIYAGQRCGEIDELKKVSNYLSKKYGTEFSLSAKELRSGCGVNTQVIQNLSSLPLGSDARMKLLKEIAVENKINWDHDVAIANSSMQSADVLDGPTQVVSGTQVSHVSIHATSSKQSSATVMHGKQVNEMAGGGLKDSFSSHTVPPGTSFNSPHHNMNLQTNMQTKSSRVRILSGIKGTTVDPYALAKAEGKMDYKVVSDYMGRQPIVTGCDLNVPGQEGQSVPPGSSKGKQISRRETELCLLDLEAAAKMALTSASEAAEAARVAVAMVRQESSGRNSVAKNVDGRHSGSSSVPELDESSSMRIVARFSSTVRGAYADSMLNDHVPEDTSEGLFKHVVFGQSSGSPLGSFQVQDLPKLKHGDLRSLEVPSSPISSIRAVKAEVDWKTSRPQKQEGSFNRLDVEHGKTVNVVSSAPQFDDYSSDEAIEKETPVHPSENAKSEVDLSDETEIQQDKLIRHICLVPQSDDESEEVSVEEEIPFYLKGRPAMVKDSADGTARAHSNELTTNLLTDNWMEERLSMSPQHSEELLSLRDEDKVGFSSGQGKQVTTGLSPAHSQELTESIHTPISSFKSSSRIQVDVVSESGRTSWVAQNNGSGMQDSHRKMRGSSSSYESSLLDSSYDETSRMSSVRHSPTRGLSGDEDKDPSHIVRRNLKWCSTLSEKDVLESPKPSAGAEALKLDFERSIQGIQASPRKYQGMSRRSIRPTRPSQNQAVPSRPPE